MKKHLNRIAVDLCTPTAERRPTTAEDIRNDVFIEDFRNSEELYEFVLDLIGLESEREEDWKGAIELEVFDKNGKFMGSIFFNEDGSFN